MVWVLRSYASHEAPVTKEGCPKRALFKTRDVASMRIWVLIRILHIANRDMQLYHGFMEERSARLKPQDVVLLLKLLLEAEPRRLVDIAGELGISQSEVSMGIRRLQAAHLLDQGGRSLYRRAAFEFLVYGLKYVFPATVGAIKRGVPTAHSTSPLANKIVAGQLAYVWPHDNGEVRGESILPLYPSVPDAALKDKRLHELLALVDAIRVGRAREQTMAISELKSRILGEPNEHPD